MRAELSISLRRGGGLAQGCCCCCCCRLSSGKRQRNTLLQKNQTHSLLRPSNSIPQGNLNDEESPFPSVCPSFPVPANVETRRVTTSISRIRWL